MSRAQAVRDEIERPALRWERSKGSPIEYDVWPERPVTIGREPTNKIPIDSPFVSKEHAVLQFTDGRYILQDLNSANGTRVNGENITKFIVSVGDVIEIGDERLVFVDRAAAATASQARRPLGKTAKLSLAALVTLLVVGGLMTLLMVAVAPDSPQTGGTSGVSTLRPAGARAAALPAVDAQSILVRDAIEQAKNAGVRPVDALLDQGMSQYKAGRLRDAAEFFAAAQALDPRNDLLRSRLEGTRTQLAEAIEAHLSGAERAFSQLRFDEAEAEWEQVLLLTYKQDPRYQQAEAGIARLKVRGAAR